MENILKKARKANNFTQEEAAKFLGVSLRSYKSYETEKEKQKGIKYEYFIDKLEKNAYIDEEHGILTMEKIKEALNDVFKEYDIEYCYIFGSYAKGKG